MSDMWLPEEEDPRMQAEQPRGERAVVLQYLRFYRTTFELKCQGLDAEQLARRAVPPSSMSLLGLLRHLASVEHSWNKRVLQEDPGLSRLYREADDRDWDFNGAVDDDDVVAEAWESWRREVADAEAWLDGDDFDRVVPVHEDQVEVRDIAVHLVEEYARHCGHADLLRECVDGRTGQ
jgi:uncharacterized damage-inducible protein DinB